MKIDLSESIRQNELPMDISVSSEDLDISLPESAGNLENLSDISIKLAMTAPDSILVALTGHAVMITECARCLTDVRLEITFQAELSLKSAQTQLLDPSDDPTDVLVEGVLDVDRWVGEELLVNLPSKVLCKEECKGMCPKCGQNLNQSECGCDRFVMDPRMQKFLDVFSEVKEV